MEKARIYSKVYLPLIVIGHDLISRVHDYIKYDWDLLLIDPDNGENVQCKLQGLTLLHNNCDNESLLQSIPTAKDKLWMKELYKAPKVTFGTIFNF